METNIENHARESSGKWLNTAQELNAAILSAGCSVESRTPIPQLADLRESGLIEQMLNIVSFYLSPWIHEPDNPYVVQDAKT